MVADIDGQGQEEVAKQVGLGEIGEHPPGDIPGRVELPDDPIDPVLKLLRRHISGPEHNVPVVVMLPAVIDDAILSHHFFVERSPGKWREGRHLDGVEGVF